jgi:cardiolipin synthase
LPFDEAAVTTANKITILRILLIPFFVMMAVYYGHGVQTGDPQDWQRWCAIAIFLVAAASDGLDGYIARHFNQKSALGVILDPIADKGLLLSGIITLSFSNWSYEFPLWFPVLIVARDLIVAAGVITMRLLMGAVRVQPSWTGKTATALQMVAIAQAMLQLPALNQRVPGLAAFSYNDLLPACAGLFTLVSGIGYAIDGIRQIHAGGHGDPQQWKQQNP